MTLQDRLTADNQRILSEDMRALKLYNASSESQTATGRTTAPGMYFNPQGQPVASKKWTIGFHISEFSDITGDNEDYKNWQAEFLNSEGETVQGRINGPLVNKTFGYVVATLTENKSDVVVG